MTIKQFVGPPFYALKIADRICKHEAVIKNRMIQIETLFLQIIKIKKL
jgi:hypothetical protein